MDDNKRIKLHEINYKIGNCCGMCIHMNIEKTWGTCKLHSYEHLKHTGGNKTNKRELSVFVFGCCDDYVCDPNSQLAGYNEFKV